MTELKTYSVLIAWDDNDDEQGEFGDTVRAASPEEAEAKVRDAMRESHIANHCDANDSDEDVAESCAQYEHDDFRGNKIFGGRVLDCHEGAIWKAAEIEKRLRDLLRVVDEYAARCGWADNGERALARATIADIDAL